MIGKPEHGLAPWRVGYHADPLGFTPLEMYEFSHRFDDIHRRFRTLYCAELAETCLREVLADFRPNLAAQHRHIERYGPEAAADFAPTPVTAQWRVQHVLIRAVVRLEGPLIDLTDVPTRQQIEHRHVQLLAEHDMWHLDLHEITTNGRAIRQTIAADLFDRGAGAVRFPSRLDGNACVAQHPLRGARQRQFGGDPIALTDLPPDPLINVTAPWGLVLEAAPMRGALEWEPGSVDAILAACRQRRSRRWMLPSRRIDSRWPGRCSH